MSKVEEVARKIANSLQMQSGLVLNGQDAIIAARAAISAVREDDERKLRAAIAKWQKLNFEHRERGKKWLKGTGPASGIPNFANGSLAHYGFAAFEEGGWGPGYAQHSRG